MGFGNEFTDMKIHECDTIYSDSTCVNLVQGTQYEVQHHTRRSEQSGHFCVVLCGECSHSRHNLWIANGRGARWR